MIVAIIVVATRKSTKTVSVTSETSNTEVVVDENVDSPEKTEEPAKTETTEKEKSGSTVGTLSTETEKKSTGNGVISTSRATEKSDNMPNTGPEEFLPIALVAGMLVTYLSSRVMVKRSLFR